MTGGFMQLLLVPKTAIKTAYGFVLVANLKSSALMGSEIQGSLILFLHLEVPSDLPLPGAPKLFDSPCLPAGRLQSLRFNLFSAECRSCFSQSKSSAVVQKASMVRKCLIGVF